MLRQKKNKIRPRQGQSIVEYTIVVGIITIVVIAMAPLVKRTGQGMIKLVADQIGVQNNADQEFDEKVGHLVNSTTVVRARVDQNTTDRLGEIRYNFNDRVHTESEALINLGFTEIIP